MANSGECLFDFCWCCGEKEFIAGKKRLKKENGDSCGMVDVVSGGDVLCRFFVFKSAKNAISFGNNSPFSLSVKQ